MSWTSRLFAPAQSYLAASSRQSLAGTVEHLIRQQKATWPGLRAAYEGLKHVTSRRLENPERPGSFVIVQHNPARIRSTAASVDQASIQSRKCFLCPENLPPEELGIEYGDDFIIACNPFPVLDRHLSIIHRRHIDQKIEGHIETLLDLSRDLGHGYLVLYNGPRCGASAPDHLHLQACSRATLPIESSLDRGEPDIGDGASDPDRAMSAGVLEDFGRSLVVLHGPRLREMSDAIGQLMSKLQQEANDDSEPMINIISTHHGGFWTVYLFPRARHRPESFFAEGDKRITVSPGAIDTAGVIVVLREEDFEKVGAVEAMKIFSEVTVSR